MLKQHCPLRLNTMRFRDVLDSLVACSRAHVIKFNPSEKKIAVNKKAVRHQTFYGTNIPYANALVTICCSRTLCTFIQQVFRREIPMRDQCRYFKCSGGFLCIFYPAFLFLFFFINEANLRLSCHSFSELHHKIAHSN